MGRIMKVVPHIYRAKIMLGTLFILVVFTGNIQADNPSGSLPFDPLSPEEIDTAIAVSLEDPRVAKELHKRARFRVIVAQLHEEDLKGNEEGRNGNKEDRNGNKEEDSKGNEESSKIPRRADVVFYQYDNDVTLNLLIDLDKRAVELFERLVKAQPPLLLEETDEALEIALKDEEVLQRLDQQEVDPETVFASGFLFREEAPCLIHRCVMLSLSTEEQPLTIEEDAFFPVVDLSAQRVDHIKTIEGDNREGDNQSER
jgi:Cu2+-containing amine oxidase